MIGHVLGPIGWLGRQKARAVAALVVIGILLPPLGELLRPYVTEAVIALLCIAFMRVDVSDLRPHLQRPNLVLAATFWTVLAIPILLATGATLFEVRDSDSGLFTGLMLQAIVSPMMAAPALAALLGLNASLILIILVLSSALLPFTAALFVEIFSLTVSISAADLGMRLFFILVGSALAGWVFRRVVGAAKVKRHADEIDGINILILFVFVSAVMGDVGIEFLHQPSRMLTLTSIAFAVFGLVLLATFIVFKRTGVKQSLAIGLMTSQRNMGLMLAATGGIVPETTWLYFAVAQFPIYLSPLLLRPVTDWLDRQQSSTG